MKRVSGFGPGRNAKRLDDSIDAGQRAFHASHLERVADHFFEFGVIEGYSCSADFSKASIDRRIAAGYHDAKIALTEPPKRAADIAKAITLRSSKQEKAKEHLQELLEPPGAAELPPAGQPALATPRRPTPAP